MSTEIYTPTTIIDSEEFLTHLSLTERRALEFLGSGASPEQTASAVGVTVAVISQLLANERFASAVADLRFTSLQSYNTRDAKADSLEDKLLEKLENLLPMMFRPMEVVRAYATINAAKRRGSSAPTTVNATQNIVSITLPQIIIDRFTSVTTNINNQVIKAGNQDLTTIQSGTLLANCKGDISAELTKRTENNAALELDAATYRANSLLLRAKNQIASRESSQSEQDTFTSLVAISSQ